MCTARHRDSKLSLTPARFPSHLDGKNHKIGSNALIGFGEHRRRYSALALAILLGGAGVLSGCSSTTHARAQAKTGQAALKPCDSRVLYGVLPVWARGGFSSPRPRMPHVLSASGQLTAILWANPLLSPRPKNHNNKILWVARVPDSSGADLHISAQRMIGASKVGSPVARTLKGGPGPSIINMPAAGCWRFTLHWAGKSDAIDLHYTVNH
jgi:hypothetical protein